MSTRGVRVVPEGRPKKELGVLRGAWSRKYLIFALTYRSYQIRYRQSMIGILWAFVPLVGTLIVATIVFHKIAKIDTGGIPYPLFCLTALVPWSFFSSAVGSGVAVIAGNSMVANLAFPRAALPLVQVGTSLLDLGVSVVVFLAYLLFTRTFLPLTALWFLPLFALELVLIFGIIFLGSAMNAFARDIRIILGSIMPLWLLLTPVMYPLSKVPRQLLWLYALNPMTGITEAFRDVLAKGTAPNFALLIPSTVWALVLFVWGTWYFGATQERFSDVV